MSLRDLAANATPGPWHTVNEGDHLRQYLGAENGIIVCDPYGPNPQDASLIALAPDLATLCADMADALEEMEADGHLHYNRTGALLARYRELEEKA